ncbi:hypothetical protein D3C75_1133160 [compost metagenome]
MRSTAKGLSSHRVKIERVVRGIISSDQETPALLGMDRGGLPVARFSGLLIRPIQQREIHQAIDNDAAAVLGVVLRPPGLEQL